MDCPFDADYIIYPDNRKKIEVAVFLCLHHRECAAVAKTPRQQLYAAAVGLVRSSLE